MAVSPASQRHRTDGTHAQAARCVRRNAVYDSICEFSPLIGQNISNDNFTYANHGPNRAAVKRVSMQGGSFVYFAVAGPDKAAVEKLRNETAWKLRVDIALPRRHLTIRSSGRRQAGSRRSGRGPAGTLPSHPMLKLLRSLMPGGTRSAAASAVIPQTSAPSTEVTADGVAGFSISPHLSSDSGFPLLDWQAAQAWVESIPAVEARAPAWLHLERAWLEHMQSALGPSYGLRESDSSLLLSTLEPNIASATLAYMSKTLQRVVHVLDGIAQVSDWGKDILIVFDDDETYYRYVSHCYPTDGEFAGSGGMYINAGCGHFATVKSDLHAIEPVIAHEMTHGCVGHLPIPAWLNEGLAVNTEQRLSPGGRPMLTPQQMHAMHRAFWADAEIQEFWSGKSFLRTDDGNMLSYDLARILVSQLSADWSRFRSFVLSANLADAGAAAAAEHLQIDLGAAASALLERESATNWAPNPAAWHEAPEHGAF